MIPRSGKSAVYSKVAATVCGLLSGALMFLVLATPALACQILNANIALDEPSEFAIATYLSIGQ